MVCIPSLMLREGHETFMLEGGHANGASKNGRLNAKKFRSAQRDQLFWHLPYQDETLLLSAAISCVLMKIKLSVTTRSLVFVFLLYD